MGEKGGVSNLWGAAAARTGAPITRRIFFQDGNFSKMTEKSKSAENSRKQGRPEYVPRLDDHEKVQVLRASGMSLNAIATAIDIHPETLRKHFSTDLDIAVAKRTAAVMMARYRAAIGGNVAAQTKFLELAGAVPTKPKRKAKPHRLGKKAQAMRDAHTADRGTPWEELLN